MNIFFSFLAMVGIGLAPVLAILLVSHYDPRLCRLRKFMQDLPSASGSEKQILESLGWISDTNRFLHIADNLVTELDGELILYRDGEELNVPRLQGLLQQILEAWGSSVRKEYTDRLSRFRR